MTTRISYKIPSSNYIDLYVSRGEARRMIWLLERAKKRINRGWIRGHSAADKKGAFTGPMDSNAVAWCALGAVEAEDRKCDLTNRVEVVLDDVSYNNGAENGITEFNDEVARTRRSVIRVMTEAQRRIAKALGEKLESLL